MFNLPNSILRRGRAKTRSRHRRQRLAVEILEDRRLLAADPFGQNLLQPFDVSRDGSVSALDALQVVNALGRSQFETGLGVNPADEIGTFVDVNGDGIGSSLDALLVINQLARDAPTIAATLPNDSGPDGLADFRFDLITNDIAIDLNVSIGQLGDERVNFRVGDESSPLIDITDQFDGESAALTTNEIEAFFGGVLPAGAHDVTVEIGDGVSRIDFTITVDREAPVPQALVDDVIRVAPDTIDIDFGEPVATNEFDSSAFSLNQTGIGSIPITASEFVDNIVQLTLSDTLADADFELSFDGIVTDLAGNVAEATTRSFAVADPVGILSVSPANGSNGVNLLRETIVNFDEPVDPTTVTLESFQVLAAGQLVSGTIRVNRTGTTATFFYDNPLPASTAISVVLDGERILGADGLPLDADGDDVPGGESDDEFRTTSLSLIPETEVFGFVRNSETQEPLAGVELTLVGFPAITATTDGNGFFELGVQDANGDGISDGLPGAEFFVSIDGSAAISTDGESFAGVSRVLESVAGQRIQIEQSGQNFDIFLPPIPSDAGTPIVAGQDTAVSLSPQSIQSLVASRPDIDPVLFDQLQLTIPADAAQDETGSFAAEAIIVLVDPEFLPGPLPPNLNPELVVSIQTPGGTNFDVPAPITFPNLDGSSPGEQVFLFSFDNDSGQFVVNGTATVSEDGMSITSDPGTGITAPGWHFVLPGVVDMRLIWPAEEPTGEEENSEGLFEYGLEVDGTLDPLFAEAEVSLSFDSNVFEELSDALSESLVEQEFQGFVDALASDFLTLFQSTERSFRISVVDQPFELDLFEITDEFRVENEFLRSLVPEFEIDPLLDISIFGGAAAGGSIEFEFELSQGSNVLEFDIDASIEASVGVSAQIENDFLCGLGFGVGEVLCDQHQLLGFAASIDENGPSLTGPLGSIFDGSNFSDAVKSEIGLDDLFERFF